MNSRRTRGSKKQSQVERIIEILEHNSSSEGKILRIATEFTRGLDFLKQYKKAATTFGSARLEPNSVAYQQAYKLNYRLSKMGYAIITGGGPGIMEAANKGAYDAGGQSVGINISLPKLTKGEIRNKYVTEWLTFKYFFVRKFMLSFASQIYVFFPGGFGTLDEFYEMATLIQTRKIDHTPLIVVDDKDGFWDSHHKWLQDVLCDRYGTLARKDLKIIHRAYNANDAIRYIKKVRK